MLLILGWVSAFAAHPQPVSLAHLLDTLRATGVEVLYSSDLVTPEMTAPAAPSGSDTLTRVRDALAAQGLVLQLVGPNHYVVTRVPPASAPSDQPAVASPPSGADVPLEEVSVYASRYSLGASVIGQPKPMTRNEIEQVPGGQSDALRAVHAIPGFVSNDSARPYIRGSLLDDVLVEFDGVPLADPFHLKNFQSLVSAFSPSAVERIDLFSGGFPVRYGTRSGGVIDITPRSLDSGYEHSIGASLLAYELSSVGHADQLPIDWLATLRHSTQDVVLEPVNGQIGNPEFSDTLGRIRYRLNEQSSFTLGWLLLDDSIQLATDPAGESATAHYRDEYTWVAFDHDLSAATHSRSVLALTHAERDRSGTLAIAGIGNGALTESRDFYDVELRSAWTYEPVKHQVWSYGFEASHANADLQYDRTGRFSKVIADGLGRPVDNTMSASASPSVTTYAVYVAHRHRWSSFETEVGARLDGQDYGGSKGVAQLSPRLNVRYDVLTHWRVYGSWGRFTQAQRVDEWRVEEGQVAPGEPELAVHTIVGFSYEPPGDTRVALELYRKRWTNVSPYFDNTLDRLSLLPDLEPDRVRISANDSESAGIELSVRHALTPSLELWGNYAWSRVADEFATDDVLRSWDQPHALTMGLAWNAGRRSAAALLGWHRGWPRTPFTWTPETSVSPAQFIAGPRNSARWENYFTVDLRAGWNIPVRGSELATWVEVTNSANRANECCVRFVGPQTASSMTEPTSWLPRIVNVGFSWRIHGPR
ncbi:MAG: TonB-dependent receptor [Gammaproteobacteria bacterium]